MRCESNSRCQLGPRGGIMQLKRQGGFYTVTDDYCKQLQADYPHLNVGRELAKMKNWLASNAPKKNIPRFIINWLNRVGEVNAEVKEKTDRAWREEMDWRQDFHAAQGSRATDEVALAAIAECKAMLP